jgi:deoxyguanosine kinase
MQKEPFFLMIEGNIGSGKSTFLNILKKAIPETNSILEPVDQWQTMQNNENLLDLFYKDMPRWAYTFQTFAFISRIQSLISHKKNSSSLFHFVERSVYCDRYCFAKNLFEQKIMSELEWFLYKEIFLWLVENYAPKPSGFIYLKTDPTISLARIKQRSRNEESNISSDYLFSLHQQHEDWLVHKKNIDTNIIDVPVLILDCNQDFEKNLTVQNQHIAAIDAFMQQIKSPDFFNQNRIINQKIL